MKLNRFNVCMLVLLLAACGKEPEKIESSVPQKVSSISIPNPYMGTWLEVDSPSDGPVVCGNSKKPLVVKEKSIVFSDTFRSGEEITFTISKEGSIDLSDGSAMLSAEEGGKVLSYFDLLSNKSNAIFYQKCN
jgi:hypothetical protein